VGGVERSIPRSGGSSGPRLGSLHGGGLVQESFSAALAGGGVFVSPLEAVPEIWIESRGHPQLLNKYLLAFIRSMLQVL
jgi:hypothetical protein